MKKIITPILFLFSLLCTSLPVQAQDYLVDYTFLGTRSKFELLLLFGQPVDYDVNLYRIHYKTTGSDMLPDTASGLLVTPVAPEGTLFPIVVYEHGTTDGPNDVPSQLRGGFEIAMAYAAKGFITAAPDYLGLGDSRGFHPYIHAATESSASFDMLNASAEYLDTQAPDWDPNYLFLCGYSQGGHASMALHRDLETLWSLIYPVTAATHMSGPYSISGVMRDKILSNDNYGNPAYIAYIVLGFQAAYGTLYNDIHEVFKTPYVDDILEFYNGTITLTALNNRLLADLNAGGNTISKRMLQDSIVDNMVNDSNYIFNVVLRDNDVYKWAPTAPTRLYYCGGDTQVPPMNSVVAEAEMKAEGAADVQAINLNPLFDHGPCVFPAVLSSIAFFQSFLGGSGVGDISKNTLSVLVQPNPATDYVTVDWDKARDGMDVDIVDMTGRIVLHRHNPTAYLDVHTLQPGMYTLVMTAGGETRTARFIRQ